MSTEPHLILVNPDVRNRNSLSLGYVGAYARSQGFGADVVDFCGDGVSPRGFRRLLRDRRPLLVGLGTYQQTMEPVIEVARIVRDHCEAKVILGGPQAWGMPDRALEELPDVDFLCRGEGEYIAASLLRALQQGSDVETVPGIAFRLPDGRVRANPNPPVPTDLDQYPSPYLTGILQARPGDRALVLSSRGCVYDCAFCMTPFMSGRSVRFHSIDRVVEELSCLYEQGVRDIWLADPLFAVNRGRTRALFNRILGLGRRFKIWCETRAELVDQEMLELMRDAGVTEISVGLESTSDAALERLGKRQSIDKITRLTREAKAWGITVNLMHIVGAPGDTYTSIIRTFDYIRGVGLLMGTNNRGNPYSVYFGTRDHAALADGSLGADWAAPSEGYPGYLSPGSQVRSRDLSDDERERIAIRQRSEHHLAALLGATERLSQLLCLSADQALSVPAQRIMELRDLFTPRASTGREGKDAPIGRLVLDGRDGGPTSDLLGQLEEALDDLTCDGLIVVLGQGESLLCDERVVNTLRRRLSPASLSAVTIVVSFDTGCWRAHRSTLLQSVKRLRLTPTSTTGREGPGSQVRLLALLNLATSSLADLDEIQPELARHGVETHPFVVFDNGGPPSQWPQWAPAQQATGPTSPRVFVGAATREQSAEPGPPFEPWNVPEDIPAIVMVTGDVLVGGGRYRAGPEDPIRPRLGVHWIGSHSATDDGGCDGSPRLSF